MKSYKGVAIAPAEQELPVQVKDYMTKKLITFTPDQSMDDVISTLLKNRISGAPVVDDHGQIIGVISEGDCMKEVVRGKYNNLPAMSGKAADYMSTNVISISSEANIFDCADRFLELHIRRFPVVENGKLIGQISQKDIMRATPISLFLFKRNFLLSFALYFSSV